MRVLVVRHGCAGHKRDFDGEDAERPLDASGERQAVALADLLVVADLGIRRLLTSPARRCRDTLVPLGRRLGLAVEDDPALAVHGVDDALWQVLAAPSAVSAALCTHGELMQPLLTHLRTQGVAITADRDDDEWLLTKGTAWLLDRTDDGRVTALRHLVPDPALDCVAHLPAGDANP